MVNMADNLALDLSRLFEPQKESKKTRLNDNLEAFECKTIKGCMPSVKTKINGSEREQAQDLFLDAQTARKNHENAQKIYRKYQENIKKSELLQGELLKGVIAGEPIEILFLKACEVISVLTNNKLFYSEVKQNVKTVYGSGGPQGEPLLTLEFNETLERLSKLEQSLVSEGDPDARKRLEKTIKAHEKRLIELEHKIMEKPQ